MNKYFDQPIVILGGFLIDGNAYKEMKEYMKTRINNKVVIVPVNKLSGLLLIGHLVGRIFLIKLKK